MGWGCDCCEEQRSRRLDAERELAEWQRAFRETPIIKEVHYLPGPRRPMPFVPLRTRFYPAPKPVQPIIERYPIFLRPRERAAGFFGRLDRIDNLFAAMAAPPQ